MRVSLVLLLLGAASAQFPPDSNGGAGNSSGAPTNGALQGGAATSYGQEPRSGRPGTATPLCEANADDVFVLAVDPYAGAMGAFIVEGCEGTSPVLSIKRGVQYTFLQQDTSNWMHPIGFSYYPDGDNADFGEGNPEMEVPNPEACAEPQYMCEPGVTQAPLYCINGQCDTLEDWKDPDDSGYEGQFYWPFDQWVSSEYKALLTIPEGSNTAEFFYFCHIHAGMSGLIKVQDPPANANTLVQPFDPATYYTLPTGMDVTCGTYDSEQFSKASGTFDDYCPGEQFLCGMTGDTFSQCMQMIDCKMSYEMRVQETPGNYLAVFMHQMIPHHRNAVNMARIALKLARDSVGWNDEETDIEAFMHAIIGSQNHQIMLMENWLYDYNEAAVECTPPFADT